MKFRLFAEIELPDNASLSTVAEAQLVAKNNAKWDRIYTADELQAKTDLTDKCGSCKYFCPKSGKYKLRGDCEKGYKSFRMRSTPKCKEYERR